MNKLLIHWFNSIVIIEVILSFSLISSNCNNNNTVHQQIPKISTTIPDSLPFSIVKYEYHLSKDATIAYQQYDIYTSEGETYIALLNSASNKFEIFNLSQKRRIFSKSLENYGLSRSELNFNSLDYWNYDSIFLATEYSIFLIDTVALKQEFKINKNLTINKNPLKLYNLNHSPLRFDYLVQGMLMETYTPFHKSSSREYYTFPIEAVYFPQTSTYRTLPMKYPPQYLKNYFGFANHVFRTVSDNINIYSFPVDNNFYIYNRRENTIDTVFGIELNDQKENSINKKYDDETEIKMQHLITIPFHLNVLHDPQRSLFFWFIAMELPLKNIDGTYNTWGDKSIHIHVYNEKGEFSNEINLGNHKYSYFKSFIGSEGIFLSYSDYKNPEFNKTNKAFIFDIIDFKND